MSTPSLLDKLAKLEAQVKLHDHSYPGNIFESGQIYQDYKKSCAAMATLEKLYHNHGPALVAALEGTTGLCCNIRGICGEHEDVISAVLAAMERDVDVALKEA